MSAEEIKVIIAKDGKTTIDVNGIKGPSCKDVTKRLQEALGTEVESETKDEFWEQEEGQDDTVGVGGEF